MWTDADFARIFTFLNNIRAVLKECPEKAAEYASVLLPECESANASLARIADAVAR